MTLFFWSLGCSSPQKNQVASQSPDAAVKGSQELSVVDEAKNIEQLRKSIPQNVKGENDEEAQLLAAMGDYTRTPSQVRSSFDQMLRKKREAYGRNEKKLREDFAKKQKTQRESFLGEQKDKLEELRRFKTDPKKASALGKEQTQERTAFYGQLDLERKEFEAEQRQKRSEFEAKIREQNQNFQSRLREYSRQYYDHKKSELLKKRSDNKQKALSEKGVPTYPVTPSGPHDDIYEYELKQFKKIPQENGIPLTTDSQ